MEDQDKMDDSKIEFVLLTEKYYSSFLNKCSSISMAPLFLPNTYNSKSWGVIALKENEIVGGWIGTLRGNIPVAKIFTKGVWFDSLPVFLNLKDKETLLIKLINNAKEKAKLEGIVLFNVTHWSRENIDGTGIFDVQETNATFTIDLKKEKDLLWKELDSKLRNIVRKAEKNEVEVLVVTGSDMVSYLDQFQLLRQETQSRAIGKNQKASMLLKSNNFFTNLLQLYDSSFFIAKHQNKIVAMALMVQSGKVIYYYSGGSDLQANKNTGASSLLIWKAIEYAKDANLEFFDMGGVPKNPDKSHPAYGVFSFKRSFGGEYQEFTSGKIIINKMKYKILNIILTNRFILRIISKKE
jgi:lipid II:glycine glycyltransferase (peptidoglycan interpeptide bridge formation enzyme)